MTRQRAEASVSGPNPATVRIEVLPPRIARRNIALAILVGSAVCALLASMFEIPRGSFLDGLGGVTSLGAGLILWCLLDHRVGTELTFSKEGVTASQGGRDLWSLSYEDPLEFRIEYEKFGDRIEAMVFAHPKGECRVEGTFRFERSRIGRAIAMIYLANADVQIQNCRASSEGRLASFLYDHRYLLEPIAMREGHVYRYRFASEIKARWNSEAFQLLQFPIFLIMVALTLHVSSLAVAIGFVGAVLLVYRFGPVSAFSRSFDDRFRLTSEGLRVTRGKKTWLFVEPRPSQETRSWLPEIGPGWVEYRNDRRRYLLDPRLIEEDT